MDQSCLSFIFLMTILTSSYHLILDSRSQKSMTDYLARFTLSQKNNSFLKCPPKSFIRIDNVKIRENQNLYDLDLLEEKIHTLCNGKTICLLEEAATIDYRQVSFLVTYYCQPDFGKSIPFVICNDAYIELRCDYQFESIFFSKILLTNTQQASFTTCHDKTTQCQPISLDLTRIVYERFCHNKQMCTINFNSVIHELHKNLSKPTSSSKSSTALTTNNQNPYFPCLKRTSMFISHACGDQVIFTNLMEESLRRKSHRNDKIVISAKENILADSTKDMPSYRNDNEPSKLLLILCLVLLLLVSGILVILLITWLIRRRYLGQKQAKRTSNILKDAILRDLNRQTSHNETFFNMPVNLSHYTKDKESIVFSDDIYQNQMMTSLQGMHQDYPPTIMYSRDNYRRDLSYDIIEEDESDLHGRDLVKGHDHMMSLSEKSRRRKIPIVQYPQYSDNLNKNSQIIRNFEMTNSFMQSYQISESDSDFLEPVLYEK